MVEGQENASASLAPVIFNMILPKDIRLKIVEGLSLVATNPEMLDSMQTLLIQELENDIKAIQLQAWQACDRFYLNDFFAHEIKTPGSGLYHGDWKKHCADWQALSDREKMERVIYYPNPRAEQ